MTLSLIKTPAAVNLIGNDVSFKINTDNQFSVAGTKANLGLTWSQGDENTDSFKLAWGNKEVIFTCATTPDASGKQYTAYSSGTTNEWMEDVVPDFQANYLLSQDFIISWNGAQNIIQILAREKGADFTLTLTNIHSSVTEDSNTAGVDQLARDFYQLLTKVFIYDTSELDNWKLLGEDRLNPDNNGNVVFKIQEYFENEFEFLFKFPEAGTLYYLRNELRKIFKIKYAETYDSECKKLFNSDSYKIINGGVDRNTIAKYNEGSTDWWSTHIAGKEFLTNSPKHKIINKTQPEKLYFIFNTNIVFDMKLKLVYTDGTILESDKISSKSVSAFDIYEFLVSYNILGIASVQPEKTLLYFEIKLLSDPVDNAISTVRRFYIDHKYRENERVFIFKNSFSVAETIRFVGVSQKSISLVKNSYELFKKEGFTWKDFESRQFNNYEIQKFKFNTGWLNELSTSPEIYAEYLREFSLSDTVYEIVNDRLYPVKIISKKQFISNSDDQLSFIEFEAERAYSDKFYSHDYNQFPTL